MTLTSRFTVISDTAPALVPVTFEGRPLDVPAGTSVAAALLSAGVEQFRTTPVSGASRAPFCMMGVCFDCLAIVDGASSTQTCLVPVAEGMCVERQLGRPKVAS